MLFRHKLPLTVGGSVLVKTFRYETLAFMFIGCYAIVFFLHLIRSFTVYVLYCM